MKRFGGWMSGKAGSSASKSLTALDEPYALQEATAAARYIIDDDIERAETELANGTSPFHKLGRATAVFLRATLGFEKEVMEQASARVAEAEEAASEHQRRAIRDPSTAHQSRIYPVGAEYALCHAESQLMSAVLAVLNESLTESLRGFYKLRKAFTVLHEISEAENKYLQAHGKGGANAQGPVAASSSKSHTASVGSQTPFTSSGVLTPSSLAEDSDDDSDFEKSEFVDAEETASGPTRSNDYQGHLKTPELSSLKLQDTITARFNGHNEAEQDFDFRSVSSDPIDLFIHSGTSMCFGLLQLLLSMVPPAFSRLLSLFSFRGDREAGFRMLWEATKFKEDVNGAMAGLITLGFHNAAIASCDVLTRDALPKARLEKLLREMRALYPKSKLWLLEEARMIAGDHRLEEAVEVMSQGGKSPLKQVEALRTFERSLNYMYLHRYEDCAKSFIICVGMNNWSHGLYYYISGACYIELYRIHKVSDPAKAQQYAAKADEYLHTTTAHTGKKGFMGRQLPFDIFVNRKIKKWDHRAKTRGCQFVDAVGVSPVEEMTYFWSGYNRMNADQLRDSLQRLAWSENGETNAHWAQEAIDEKAMLAFLKGTCLRFLGQIAEAETTLTEGVLSHDMIQLKACDNPDTWPVPVGHYEMAVCLWEEAGRQDGDKAVLQKCSDELAKVEKSESYELEARVGLKVATARQTLRKCGVGDS